MDCRETREILEEYRRGELAGSAVTLVEQHLAACASCRRMREETDRLVQVIHTLPRTPAPASLARAVRRLGRRRSPVIAWLARPWVSAAVAALLVAAVLAPWVRFGGPPADDPVQRLLQGGVAEHTRIVLQLQGLAPAAEDPRSAFARVRSLTSVEVPPAVAGIPDLTLLEARPTVLVSRRAAAVVLRDRASSITTYFAVPGQDLPMPTHGRVQIEQYRPYMQQVGEFNVVYWKQGEYACVIVSDRDASDTRQLFLKVRRAL
jgi:anti-sigma factor RsiW